jgi:hypothetical protein
MPLWHDFCLFPLKTVNRSDIEENIRMTQKMPNSCKRMKRLIDLKKPCHLSRQMQDYVSRYEIIYRRVIKNLIEGILISMF